MKLDRADRLIDAASDSVKQSLRELEGLSLTETLTKIGRVAELKLLSVLATYLEQAQSSTLGRILMNPHLRLDVRALFLTANTCLINRSLAYRCHLIVHVIIGLIRIFA